MTSEFGKTIERRVKRLPGIGRLQWIVKRVDNRIHLKFFYEERPDQDLINKAHTAMFDLFEKEGYSFMGVTEYMDNGELCFSFERRSK